MNYFLVIAFVLFNGVFTCVNGLSCYQCLHILDPGASKFSDLTCRSPSAKHLKECPASLNDACGKITGTTTKGYEVLLRVCVNIPSSESRKGTDYFDQEEFSFGEDQLYVKGMMEYCDSKGCNSSKNLISFPGIFFIVLTVILQYLF